MLNKKIFIIYIIIINMIISVCISTNVFANGGIYATPAVALDASSKLWVYVGSGDKTDPTGHTSTERFYAIRDIDRSTTLVPGDLENITSSGNTYTNPPDGNGWFWVFAGFGEKVMAEAVVTNKKVYFTTYNPDTGTNPCNKAGTSNLYIIDYITGAGLYTNGSRSANVGTGIASAPVISKNPSTGGNDVYVSTSEVTTGNESHTNKQTDPSTTNTPNRSLLYWHDMRVK
jgi:hypothetical protein